MKHILSSSLLSRAVKVDLVGCGGTGTQMLTGLARLHTALIALGHPAGLKVTVFDPDTVSVSNVGRQLFSPSDIGMSKAVVLTHRLNCWFGLDWDAQPTMYPLSRRYDEYPDILITCVDTAKARREIIKGVVRPAYWLDCGNGENTGQVFLTRTKTGPFIGDDLPLLSELLPEVFDESIPEDNTPSCSLAEALEHQNLVINQAVATWGVHLLWNLFREGGVEVCGYWINLASGHVLPVTLDSLKRKPARAKCKGGTNG